MIDSPAVRLARVSDVLATAKDLNEAIHMACGYVSDGIAKAALQAVSDCLREKLSEAHEALEGVREDLR